MAEKNNRSGGASWMRSAIEYDTKQEVVQIRHRRGVQYLGALPIPSTCILFFFVASGIYIYRLLRQRLLGDRRRRSAMRASSSRLRVSGQLSSSLDDADVQSTAENDSGQKTTDMKIKID